MSIWEGTEVDLANLPTTGTGETEIGFLVGRCWFNSDKGIGLEMSGHDYYGFKQDADNFYFMCWSEYMDYGHEYIVSKNNAENQSYNKFYPPNIPQGYTISYGKWTTDEKIDIAQNEARMW